MLQEDFNKKEHLNEIISILNDINKDIIHLHRYAAEDFTTMGSVFREYSDKADKLANNAKKAFELLGANKDSRAFSRELNEYIDNVSECYHYIKTKIETTSESIDELCRNFEMMIIPVKNLNQHIVSLKLVLANIKIYPSFNDQQKTLDSDLELIFEQIKSLNISFSEGIESMQNLLENVKNLVDSDEKPHLVNLNEFLNSITNCKEHFLKKHQEALTQIPELSTKISDNTGNSHKIIVELQYHDIIRQKIEHIQETHAQIIQQLSQYQNNNENEANDDIKEYLVQVGDIVRIQASQLLRANKEYESAIDTISEGLLSFSDNITSITKLCKKLSIKNNDIPQCGIDNIINENALHRIKLMDTGKKLDEQYTIIENELTAVTSFFTSMNEWIGKLNTSLDMIDTKAYDIEESRKISNSQVNELLADLLATVSQLNKLLDNIGKISNKKVHGLNKNDGNNEFNRLIKLMLEHEQKFLPNFNQHNETISAIFTENSNDTSNLADNILKAVRSIKYYDYFDKLADDIINKLNYISESYNISESATNINSIEHIRDKYTMKSERKTHDITLAHGTSDIEIFDENDESDGSNHEEIF